jgi:multicomponent Na+:H+ antiporter subunit G
MPLSELIRFLIVDGLLIAGTFFVLVAGIALVRMPDLLLRMQGSAKAGTLGVGLIILAVAIAYGTSAAFSKAVLIILFYFLTAPVAGHVISRAAYRSGAAMWDRTTPDEYRAAIDAEESAPDS